MAVGDVIRHEPDDVEPLESGLAVPAQAIGFLHRRLQRVHVDLDLARRGVDHAAGEALGKAVRPGGREENARAGVVVLRVEIGEEREIIGLDLRLVVVHARSCPFPELRGQRVEEGEFVERELRLVAHARRKGEADSGIEVNLDRGMRAPRAERAVVVEAVVVQQRAAGPDVVIRGHAGTELRRQEMHVRPVEERVLEEVVLHALLDRRHAPAVAVGIDEAGHQQLLAVPKDFHPG